MQKEIETEVEIEGARPCGPEDGWVSERLNVRGLLAVRKAEQPAALERQGSVRTCGGIEP